MTKTLSIAQLRAEFDGQLTAPGDPGYDQARTVFIGGLDHRPAAVIRATGATDVARIVNLARDSGLELAVRGGGHSIAGHAVSHGGIVLDLSALRDLDIDPQRRTAWAQTGLTAGAYTTATAAHGLATGFGDTGAVGIGGITLGGGVGFLSRKHGLTVDHLLAAEVVTADGRLLHTDATHHPDLFWAIRGGGGNFGVATRFHFRLHQLDTITGGTLILPATPETIAGFVAAAQAAPDELSTIANIMPAPPTPSIPETHHGQLILLGLLCHAGDPATGAQVIAPFRGLGPPLLDAVTTMAYPRLYEGQDPPEDFHPTSVMRNLYRDTFDLATAETILTHLEAGTSPMRSAQLRVLGGAISRLPAGATAYPHRQRQIMANVAALYQGEHDRQVQHHWVTRLAAALYEPGADGAYVNFIGDEGPERARAAYPGSTWDYLRQIKARYDPTNLFHLNQNIPPATGRSTQEPGT